MSQPLYTMPMPPSPSGDTISNCESSSFRSPAKPMCACGPSRRDKRQTMPISNTSSAEAPIRIVRSQSREGFSSGAAGASSPKRDRAAA